MIKFTKMHGLGNDFIVINTLTHPISPDFLSNNKLSDRHLGIGYDQALLLGASTQADFSCQIFNADGTEAEQCGNGMRCIARYIHEEKLINKNTLTIETKAGIVKAVVHDYEHIQIEMGIPIIDRTPLKSLIESLPSINDFAPLVISMGNPHIILKVPSIKTCPIEGWGPIISQHPFFPQGINVGFMEVVNREHIRLRTYERGAGETFACGSNACAAVVAGINNNILEHQAQAELELGSLWIEWLEKDASVTMIGPTETVFSGELNSIKNYMHKTIHVK